MTLRKIKNNFIFFKDGFYNRLKFNYFFKNIFFANFCFNFYNYYLIKILIIKLINFNLLLSNKYYKNDSFFLNYPTQFKYNWISVDANFYKFFNTDVSNSFNLEFNQFYQLSGILEKNKKNLLENVIFLKKNTGFIKKDNKFNSIVLNRLHSIKTASSISATINYNYLLNKKLNKKLKNQFYIDYKNFLIEDEISFKNIDVKHKSFQIFKKNRDILRQFFSNKITRQFKFNKKFKQLFKTTSYFLIYFLEFRLLNILIRSSFFISFKDALFFLKNGYIIVNSNIIKNPNYFLKINDIVKVFFNKYYYLYYR
jgi:ribosomal protein S4